jgi:hypothetical protein
VPTNSIPKALVLLMAVALCALPADAQTKTFTDLFVSSGTVSLGTPVTLTAAIDDLAPGGNGIADGTVTFYDCATGQALTPPVNVLKSSPRNLIPNSDNLNTDWIVPETSQVGVALTSSISPGAPDPLGGTNASLFSYGNAVHGIGFTGLTTVTFPSGLPSGPYTFSFWMQTQTGTASPWVNVDWVNVSGFSEAVTQQFTAATSWRRYSITYPSLPSSFGGLGVWEDDADGDMWQNLYVWGLQLEAGSTPGAYVSTSSSPSTSAGGVATATINIGWATGSHAIYAVYSGSSTHQSSVSDAVWIWVEDGTEVTIASTVLPVVTNNLAYSAALQAVGGQPPYTWSTQMSVQSPPVSVFLPAGLQLSSSGVISGITTGGTDTSIFRVPVSVVDSTGNAAGATINITVNGKEAERGHGGCDGLQSAIFTVVPDSGPVGTLVTITGNNLLPTPDWGTVTFNGVAGTIQSWTNSQITATVPASATSGWMIVTFADGKGSITPAWFTVDAAPGKTGGSCVIAEARPQCSESASNSEFGRCRPESGSRR